MPQEKLTQPRRVAAPSSPGTQPSSRPRSATTPQTVMSRFNVAFGLMSVIPLLTCFYLITVRFFSIKVFEGINGFYFLMALVIALLGLLVGHQLIRDIIRQLVETNAKLERLYAQQAAFVGNVAHEFRAPLAVFKGALDNLADGLHGPLSADQAEPVTMCQKEVNRLKRLVGDLLDLTRIEAGKLPLQREEVDLSELLSSVAQLVNGLIKERSLCLSVELPSSPIVVTGDPDRLKQVFVNLVTNAIKFTPAGTVAIRLLKDSDAAQVEIEDTGRGIAESDLERIFDKFERVGEPMEEGAGLGLPIARDIVELHQGRIWAESRIGQGSRFVIRLPLGHSGGVGS